MIIFVTGGAGYIGSHAAKALHEHGFAPVVLDNLSTGWPDFVRWGELVECDLTDRAAVGHAFRKHEPEAVMHFAAASIVPESMEDPQFYYRNNVVGMLNVLEGMRAVRCRHLVFSSTCAVYGVPSHVPIRESQPLAPISPYGRSKAMIESMLADFDRAYGIRSLSLRYFNACGADPSGTIGERHVPETHLIPRVLASVLDARQRISVFGNDYPTPDGTAIRDFIHVTDLCAAHVVGLQRLLDGAPTDVVNLGSGAGRSVLEVIAAVGRASGETPVYDVVGRRAGDPPTLVADVSKARELLSFEPRFSDLDAILASALRWHENEHKSS